MKSKSLNTIFSGSLLGLLMPALFLLIILLVRKDSYSLKEFFNIVFEMEILPKIISICLIPNLLLFFIFIWSNQMKAARGVILAMFFAGIIIGLLKLI